MIHEFPMRVFKWSPEFRLDSESPHAPVWVSLEALPIHFFDKIAVFLIASAIGPPLKIDAATLTLARLNVASVCVDVDLSKLLPNRIWIAVAEGGFWQRIDYEDLPSYCENCHKQGHEISQCRLLHPKGWNEEFNEG